MPLIYFQIQQHFAGLWVKKIFKRLIINPIGHIKSFCKTCGSALPNMQFDGTLLVVPAGSLDTQVHMRPQGHIFLAHKATWDKELSTVPGYAYLPTTDQNQKED